MQLISRLRALGEESAVFGEVAHANHRLGGLQLKLVY